MNVFMALCVIAHQSLSLALVAWREKDTRILGLLDAHSPPDTLIPLLVDA